MLQLQFANMKANRVIYNCAVRMRAGSMKLECGFCELLNAITQNIEHNLVVEICNGKEDDSKSR